MDRFDELRRFALKHRKGIEIGPWCNPITPKSEGYDCFVLDVFDTATLVRRATDDDGLPKDIVSRIEEVDLVGSSASIAELVGIQGMTGSIGYVISSHNFEHIPNPVRFLQGCAAILEPGGVLSMAIPDKRGCFDYFRPLSSLAQFLEADFTRRDRPTRAQIFERFSLHARCDYHGRELIGFPIGADPDSIYPFETLEVAFNEWLAFERHPDDTYVDTHCWTFTPASFELIMRDLIFLNVFQLELMEVIEGGENEFYVHLSKPPTERSQQTREDFYRKRAELMRRVLIESSPSLAAQLAQTTSQLQSLTAHYQALLSRKETQLIQAEEARAHAEHRVETMLNSKSWIVTSPIRALRKKLF